MNHEPYILLVNAHPERCRRDDDIPARLISQPFLLAFHAVVCRETSVIRCGADIVRSQTTSEAVAFRPKGDVDDTRDGSRAFVSAVKSLQALRILGTARVDCLQPGEGVCEAVVELIGGEADFVVQVWAGGCCGEDFEFRWVEGKGGDDVFADRQGSGCRKADYGDRGEGGAEVGEVCVRGAEVVTPFGDAMGFVDGDTGEFTMGVDGVEMLPE